MTDLIELPRNPVVESWKKFYNFYNMMYPELLLEIEYDPDISFSILENHEFLEIKRVFLYNKLTNLENKEIRCYLRNFYNDLKDLIKLVGSGNKLRYIQPVLGKFKLDSEHKNSTITEIEIYDTEDYIFDGIVTFLYKGNQENKIHIKLESFDFFNVLDLAEKYTKPRFIKPKDLNNDEERDDLL